MLSSTTNMKLYEVDNTQLTFLKPYSNPPTFFENEISTHILKH